MRSWFFLGPDSSSKVNDNTRESETVNIADILLADIDMSHLYVDVSEREAAENEDKESPVDISYSVKEEIPDNVLEVRNILLVLLIVMEVFALCFCDVFFIYMKN